MAANLPLIAFICLSAALCLLTAGAVVKNHDDSACPEGWTRFKTRCFKVFVEKKTWANAEKNCYSFGGHLASVHSSEENSFLVNLIHDATGSNQAIWLGGHDAVKENLWMWSDGTQWDYTNWAEGEPDNHNKEHHNVHISYKRPGFWNDAEESWSAASICAKDALKPPSLTLEGFRCTCTTNKK